MFPTDFNLEMAGHSFICWWVVISTLICCSSSFSGFCGFLQALTKSEVSVSMTTCPHCSDRPIIPSTQSKVLESCFSQFKLRKSSDANEILVNDVMIMLLYYIYCVFPAQLKFIHFQFLASLSHHRQVLLT